MVITPLFFLNMEIFGLRRVGVCRDDGRDKVFGGTYRLVFVCPHGFNDDFLKIPESPGHSGRLRGTARQKKQSIAFKV